MALPPTTQTIVSLIGHGLAMALTCELGGRDFRFPVGKKSDNWETLVELVGQVAAGKLIEQFGGDEVYIPMCQAALKDDRNRRMIARYDNLLGQGWSTRKAVDQLVFEFRPIAGRTVERIVNRPPPAAASEYQVQGSLFD